MPLTILHNRDKIIIKEPGIKDEVVDLSSISLPAVEKNTVVFQKLVNNFPKAEQLPGVSSIEFLEKPKDPKMLIIHCGNSHIVSPSLVFKQYAAKLPDEINAFRPKQLIDLADMCINTGRELSAQYENRRKGILNTIKYFETNYGIKSAYCEGKSVGGGDVVDNGQAEMLLETALDQGKQIDKLCTKAFF